VAVYYAVDDGFDLDAVTAPGGAGAGTVYLRDTDASWGTLAVDGDSGNAGWTPLGLAGQDVVTIPDDVIVRGSHSLVRPEHAGMTLHLVHSLKMSDAAYMESNGSLTVEGPLMLDASTLACSGPLFADDAVAVGSGANLNVAGTLSLADTGFLSGQFGGKFSVAGDLVGSTRIADRFEPLGILGLNGSGTAAAPQHLEVMSRDLGPTSAGFSKNFAYWSVVLSQGTYVTLRDEDSNSLGTGAEALYTDALIVPGGSTLDLNGFHVYAREMQIDGAIVGGTITPLQAGGELRLGSPVMGSVGSPT
jgi:hypothetical protein